MEARINSMEEEHRAEVTSLRHALEECVKAIGTCAQVIDAMCVDGEAQRGDGRQGPAAGAAQEGQAHGADWHRAATALHDAAHLGMQALGNPAAPSAAAIRRPSSCSQREPAELPFEPVAY